jgi:MFS family permease
MSEITDPSAPPTTQDAPTAHRDFALLWAGQSTSLVGDQLMRVALPVLAVGVVGVSAAEAALLPFALFLPFLLIGLPVGPIVDRLPRRPVMLACDVARWAVYLAIAGLAVAGLLPFWSLLLLAAIAGTASVFFEVAYSSYLPALFADPRHLHRGNSRLFLSESVARTLGPMLAGPLMALGGAVGAVLANVGALIVSVLTLGSIRHREERRPSARRDRGWLVREMREGLAFVFGHPKLEPVLTCGSVYVLFLSMIEASIVLYCLQVLGLDLWLTGLVVGAAALGYPLGNLVSGPLIDRLGTSRTLVLGATVSVVGIVLMPTAGSLGSVAGLVAASVLHGAGEGTFGPTSLTLRQTETPAGLLGRVNSVQRFLLWGAMPLGSLLAAGAIATVGLSGALWVGALGTVACLPPLLRRGVRADLGQPRPARA